METMVLWVLVVAAVVAYPRYRQLSAEVESGGKIIAALQIELHELREKLAELTDDFENATLTGPELEEKHFNRLPALTSDQFVGLEEGSSVSLVLNAFGSFDEVQYVHGELTYRTPGEKDAVAHGKAKFADSDQLSDVRILFSRPNATATLRGLAHEGRVKEGRLLRRNSAGRRPLHGGT